MGAIGIGVIWSAAVAWSGEISHLAAVPEPKTGNVIFLHPDGTSVSHWTAARMASAGPDGMINWDRLPVLAVYRGHMKTALAATSHGGSTTHAFGVKVDSDSYGMDRDQPLTALSGKPMSIMREPLASRLAVGVVNSGNIDEPGTGVFLASTQSRKNGAEIAEQVVLSDAHVILSGGERWLLPNCRSPRPPAMVRRWTGAMEPERRPFSPRPTSLASACRSASPGPHLKTAPAAFSRGRKA